MAHLKTTEVLDRWRATNTCSKEMKMLMTM